MDRRRMFAIVASAAVGGPNLLRASPAMGDPACSRLTHLAWVAEALKRMQTIGVGMTRQELLTVFTTEGGLSTGLNRTFVSRDCLLFKVDVEFQPVGRAERDGNGRVTTDEDEMDVIKKVSPPYLQFSIMD
jgi:hypothetical protein